ncbi:hypothetical protein EIP91_004573 [Steccherinum ochraceum]|uniref:Protein kinase domain-containing protein n=1 Tax=Steccherinum ochraceum TaxID=92696 RepID=A0A4R0REP4_9APHY|nr:hypothetical protein EIP91_004573 [Steccherinum ochraceum]
MSMATRNDLSASDPWGGYDITDDYWRSRYYILADRGYTLRDHFCPDKQPTTRNSSRPWNDVPDGIDARIPGGKLVIVRRMSTDSQELSLLLKFSQPEMRSAPGNLCVPVYAVFEDPDDPSSTFVVTPHLFMVYQLQWRNLDDILNYISRVLEGLVFFHSHGISNVLPCCPDPDFPVRFDLSTIVYNGDWNAVNPLRSLARPNYTFFERNYYWMRDTVPFYLFHLHHCRIETSIRDQESSSPPAYSPPGKNPTSPLPAPSTRAAMTPGMKSDLRSVSQALILEQYTNVSDVFFGLDFLRQFRQDLESENPPDALTALRRFRELHYSRSWLKRRFWFLG